MRTVELKQMIDRVRAFLRSLPSGSTPEEIAERIFAHFPGLWEALAPILRLKWVVQQLRSIKDGDQLPLFGRFPIRDAILSPSESVEIRREDWTPEQWQQKARRHYTAGVKNFQVVRRLDAAYRRQHGQQLELWDGITAEDALANWQRA